MNSASHYYNQNTYVVSEVHKVIDGDTVHIEVDLGLRASKEVYLRLADIDTPELRGGDEISRTRATAAKQALEGLLGAHADGDHRLLVQFRKGKSFDRWIGYLTIRNEKTSTEVNVNDWMVDEHHAVRLVNKNRQPKHKK